VGNGVGGGGARERVGGGAEEGVRGDGGGGTKRMR